MGVLVGSQHGECGVVVEQRHAIVQYHFADLAARSTVEQAKQSNALQ